MNLRLIPGGGAAGPTRGLLVTNAAEVVTLEGGLRRGASQAELGVLRAPPAGEALAGVIGDAGGPAIACRDGRILAVGPETHLTRFVETEGFALEEFARLDARGGTVTPGLVDPHTHLLFAGTRERELGLRQQGASYLEILAAGGGILSTVAATRAATTEELRGHGRRWLAEMLGNGVTTVEAKSGYGLDLATEIRLVDLAHELGKESPVDVVPTFLGAHAVPPEFRDRPDGTEAYVRHVIDEQIPGIAAHGRARFCDVFCESGVFTADQARRILEAAAAFGMQPRLHADELQPSGGAELAAAIGAASADHLGAISDAGLEALAAAAEAGRPVVAVLLPATTWYLMKERHAPARTLIDRGVPVALGTDFNPGTSPVASLPLAMAMACVELRMSPAEALAAVTINAAHALGLGDESGSIEAGKAADLVVWDVPSHEQLAAWPGTNLARAVVKAGRVVVDRR